MRLDASDGSGRVLRNSLCARTYGTSREKRPNRPGVQAVASDEGPPHTRRRVTLDLPADWRVFAPRAEVVQERPGGDRLIADQEANRQGLATVADSKRSGAALGAARRERR